MCGRVLINASLYSFQFGFVRLKIMANFILNVEGLHCKSCVLLVEDVLHDKGAKNVRIVLDEKKHKAVVSCSYDGDKLDVVNAIKNAGYKVLK